MLKLESDLMICSAASVDFDSAIDSPDKCISRQEPNSSGEQSINQAREEGVCKEQHRAHESGNVQDVEVVIDAVCEDPDTRRAAQEEGLPPPVVVLIVELAYPT